MPPPLSFRYEINVTERKAHCTAARWRGGVVAGGGGGGGAQEGESRGRGRRKGGSVGRDE